MNYQSSNNRQPENVNQNQHQPKNQWRTDNNQNPRSNMNTLQNHYPSTNKYTKNMNQRYNHPQSCKTSIKCNNTLNSNPKLLSVNITPVLNDYQNRFCTNPRIEKERLLFFTRKYKENPPKNIECNPVLSSLNSDIYQFIDYDLNTIPIDFTPALIHSTAQESDYKTLDNQRTISSIEQNKIPFGIKMNKMDSLCIDGCILYSNILRNAPKQSIYNLQECTQKLSNMNISNTKTFSHLENNGTFITNRHNIRSICKAVIYNAYPSAYTRNKIQFAIFKQSMIIDGDSDYKSSFAHEQKRIAIRMENINNDKSCFVNDNLQSLQGLVFEHLLTDGRNENETQNAFVYDLKKDECRLLLKMNFNDDISVVIAAEMDACFPANDWESLNDVQLAEIKCSKAYPNLMNNEGLWKMYPSKVINIWSQCFFGDVGHLVVGYRNGRKSEYISDGNIVDIECFDINDAVYKHSKKMRGIVRDCKKTVYYVLQWLKKFMMQEMVEENVLYLVYFDYDRNSFVVQELAENEEEKEEYEYFIREQGFTHGLVADSQSQKIEIQKI